MMYKRYSNQILAMPRFEARGSENIKTFLGLPLCRNDLFYHELQIIWHNFGLPTLQIEVINQFNAKTVQSHHAGPPLQYYQSY